jgi:S1-C subfamily serine protease
MQRKALYSRATRTRSATASVWPGTGAGEPPPPDWADEAGSGPSVSTRAWARIKAFYGRHDRPLLVAASVVISLAAVGTYSLLHPLPRALTQRDIDGAVQYTLAHTPPGIAESTRAAAIIAPSVVEVEGYLSPAHAAALAAAEAKHSAAGAGAGKDHGMDLGHKPQPKASAPALPDKPLASGAADEPEPDAIGSGVIITQSGRILTALHVISSTDHWVVVFADGSKSDADVVGSQPENDLAVLQPKHLPDELQPAALASTAGLRPGDEVVASGFPFGIGPSVSAGVVSGL